jgi:hypothetical protein
MQKRAVNMVRDAPHYRRECFHAGLEAAGFKVCHGVDEPRPGDVLVIWNRYGRWDVEARRFEAAGAQVVVTENGYVGEGRYALALGHHAGLGVWRPGSGERWDALGIEVQPWRPEGGETIILDQRGIGERGIASPEGWAGMARARWGGRIRQHPGKEMLGPSLAHDLRNASRVVTWASSAALHALILGVPVFYGLTGWIGRHACLPTDEMGAPGLRHSGHRLETLRQVAWAQWTLEEISSGFAFQYLGL